MKRVLLFTSAILVLFVIVFILLWRMNGVDEKNAALVRANDAGALIISETGVMTLEGVRIPVSSYSDEDGTPTMNIHLPDGVRRVSAGDTFTVGGMRFTVHSLGRRTENPLGWIAIVPADAEVIQETTRGTLDDVAVGFADVWERTLTIDGEESTVLSGRLFPENGEPFDVYADLRFALGGKKYRVFQVWKDAQGNGWVSIVRE